MKQASEVISKVIRLQKHTLGYIPLQKYTQGNISNALKAELKSNA